MRTLTRRQALGSAVLPVIGVTRSLGTTARLTVPAASVYSNRHSRNQSSFGSMFSQRYAGLPSGPSRSISASLTPGPALARMISGATGHCAANRSIWQTAMV
ncbi:hypothetical protein D3C72_1733660 [compost metagenome]